jgi:hypothetical protein
MPEPTGTIFTVLLFLAAFLGSGAYAVLSMADFRAARRGFCATAVSFAAIGLILGIMTTWPLSIRVAVCAAFMAIAGGGLIWIFDYLKVREALGVEKTENFAYIGTISVAEDPSADHFAFVNNRTGGPLPNVLITIQSTNDIKTVRSAFFPYVPQGGRPFVPNGEVHTLRLPAGRYSVIIEAQDGSFIEFLNLHASDKGLKREIQVYRMPPPGVGGSMSPLLTIKDD